MAKKEHISETPATQMLRKHKVAFSEHPYDYEEHGGTTVSARELGVDEHAVVKTLVMQDEAARPLIVLMHGDRTVSLKELARQIPCKKVEPCKPEVAQRHSGLPGRGHVAVRRAQGHAGVRRGQRPCAGEDLHQRRPARLPRRHRAAGADDAARRAAGELRELTRPVGRRRADCRRPGMWNTIVQTLQSEFSDAPDVEQATRILTRLLLAAVLGGLLGYERESRGKAAGIRTHMLVAMGAVPGAWLRFRVVNHYEPMIPRKHWGTFGVNVLWAFGFARNSWARLYARGLEPPALCEHRAERCAEHLLVV
eukprot:gene46186-56546_t